jgi:hypothetical protein
MVFKLSHYTAGFVLFAVLVGLLVQFYDNGLVENYDITKGDTRSGVTITDFENTDNTTTLQEGNIVDQFKQMNLIEGINKFSEGFLALTKVTNVIEFVGALVMAGLGALQTIVGVFTLPFSIVSVITAYYGGSAPMGIIGGLASMVLVYGGFLIISIKVGRDL